MTIFKITSLIFIAIFFVGCESEIQQEIPTHKVKRGEFTINVVETGELKATRSTMIVAPTISWRFGDLKITKIIEDGKDVQQGDTLVMLDQADVQKSIIDAQAELDIAKAEYEKMKADQLSKIQDLEADLKMAEISFEISQLELEQSTYKADIDKKRIQLQLQQAEISLKKAKDEIVNQKKIHIENLRKQELKIQQLEANLVDANDTLQKLILKAPAPGLAIIEHSWSSGNKWQVGEQPWRGVPLISLPDLTEMKAITQINEIDISKLKLEQNTRIKLDADPDTTYTGKIVDIAVLAKRKDRKSKVKVFPVEILIDGQDKALMPGMSVSCEIIVDKLDSVIFIPLEGLFKEAGKNIVYVSRGGSFKAREVKIGIENNDFVVVEDGLKEKEKIALRDPTELEKKKKRQKKQRGKK